MLKKIIHTLIVLAFLSGMFFAYPASPAHAATLTVNTLTDENDGSCLDGDCSLRDAIAVAADNDTITFSVTGTITLTAALTVDKSLTITGPGSAQLTLDGNDQYQIFLLSEEFPTNTINISGMTMTKGYADPLTVCGGGAIRSWAFLTMNDVVITNNHAPSSVGACEYPRGGGILFFDNPGSLTLTNSTVSNNSTAYGGGGIHFGSTAGNISLNNVIVDNNQTTEADGGGVEIVNALSTVTITNSTFSNNDASGGGGAEGGGVKISTTATTPTVTIQNSLFSSNTALLNGGGIYILKLPVTITNSTIADNSASGDGGGLYNYDGTVTIDSSTIKGNIVGSSGASEGGGIYNLGNNGTGSITIVNSTLTGNSSTNGKGGAIFNHASGNTASDIATVNIINSTIVGNSAKNNFGGGGIVASRAAGNEISTITLSNSILYGNTLTTGTGGENCLIINSVTIVTNNHNLLQNLVNDCTPGVNDVTSALAASAVVNALASNGGTTQTMSLPGGSPAIDAGDNDICTNAPVNNTSQNGVTRPFGDYCDIGAYELGDTTAPTVTSSVRASTNPTNAASVDFTVTFSESVTGVDLTDFTLTTSGVSSTAVSGLSGTGSVYTVTVNTGSGAGTIRLDVLDDNTIIDLSLNPLSAGFTSGQGYMVRTTTFTDVPTSYWAWQYIERLASAGVTGGCGTGIYCPDSTVTRAQMAIFLLKGIHGSSYTPPAVGLSTGFADVATDYWAAAWIKQLAAEGITGGCGGGNYCPDNVVTRAQMAIFLLKAKNGSSYTPPAVGASTGFNDVATDAFGAAFIKQLVADGITAGCGNSNYCPNDSVTRAQMAVFLVRAFNLP